jgi:hypothetical protein
MITRPLHLLHMDPTAWTRPRRPADDLSHSCLFNPQSALIPVVVFLACEALVPGPLVDVAHLVAARVAQHELLAGSVDLARRAAFTQAPAEVRDLLHCAAG